MPPELQFVFALLGPMVEQHSRESRATILWRQTEAIKNLLLIAQALAAHPESRAKAVDLALALLKGFELERVPEASPSPTARAPEGTQ